MATQVAAAVCVVSLLFLSYRWWFSQPAAARAAPVRMQILRPHPDELKPDRVGPSNPCVFTDPPGDPDAPYR